MAVKNFYPELPVIPYQKTTISMKAVIAFLASLAIDKEIKRVAYVIFRNEGANGNSGVNNNFIGFQSDSGRWDKKYDKFFVGTCIKVENRTGKQRGFLCFSSWQDSLTILTDKVNLRGMYVGGKTHFITDTMVTGKEVLAKVYYQEWVKGDEKYVASKTEIENFESMYNQAEKLFVK